MNVNTWADGFGNWHAEITQQGVANFAEAEKAAREAILAELRPREARLDESRLSLRLVARVGQYDELVSEYVESWPTDDDPGAHKPESDDLGALARRLIAEKE